ncbi:SOS response-associated peptidase family protein [Anaerotignum sp.]|uniref:SOS response-associated peptidase family protein n=1 Tax=Anaerotignum sp. TaxID=2039241 RepID=UPI00332A524F
MCRLFLWKQEDDTKAVQKIMGEIGRKYPHKQLPSVARPTDEIAYLLASPKKRTTASVAQWGFRVSSGNLVYNARQETVLHKDIFTNCFLSGRCIVPAHSFYEWDKDRNCFEFSMVRQGLLYFAGLYRGRGEQGEIVILTTHSRGVVGEIHHRMPLILDETQLRAWLYDANVSQQLLSQGIISLKKEIVEG